MFVSTSLTLRKSQDLGYMLVHVQFKFKFQIVPYPCNFLAMGWIQDMCLQGHLFFFLNCISIIKFLQGIVEDRSSRVLPKIDLLYLLWLVGLLIVEFTEICVFFYPGDIEFEVGNFTCCFITSAKLMSVFFMWQSRTNNLLF